MTQGITGKIGTAVHLLATGQGEKFLHQTRHIYRQRRLKAANGKPFTYQRHGFRRSCFPDLEDDAYHYLTDGDDNLELDVLRAWLRPGDLFVDCGANVGTYSLSLAQHISDSGLVVAIDASEALIKQIEKGASLLLLDNLRGVCAALGDSDGTATFHIARSGTTTSQSLLAPDGFGSDYEAVTVPAKRIATILSEVNYERAPAAIKLDVEGAEVAALDGAPPELFGSSATLWIVEFNFDSLGRFGRTAEDILRFFDKSVHSLWLIPKYPPVCDGERGALRRLKEGEKFDDAAFFNLVAIPASDSRSERTERILST